MAITLSNAPGGLFDRIGRLAFAIESANAYLAGGDLSSGGLKSLGVSSDNINAEFASTLQNLKDGLYAQRDSTRQALSAWKSYLQALAQQVVIEMADADVTLTNKTIEAALAEVIDQMEGSGGISNPDDDVDASTVSATPAADAANTGDGVIVASVLRPDGLSNQLVYAETIEAICDGGAQDGATESSEVFTVRGEVAVSDRLGWDWPGGSGATGTLAATDAALDASGNLLTNSDFEDFDDTANLPDNWVKLVGALGTDILEHGTAYKGTAALEFQGTAGAVLSSIAQTFDSSSGTLGTLKPRTVYHFHCWIKKSASLAAGAVTIDLIDGSDTVITDILGSNNAVTIAHGTITTSYASFSGAFRTPAVLPAVYKLRVHVSTALTDGESVYIDHLSLAEATQLYDSGPFLSCHSGADEFAGGDKFTIVVAQNREGELQEWFDRLFNMRALVYPSGPRKGLTLQLPYDTGGNETIADSKVA